MWVKAPDTWPTLFNALSPCLPASAEAVATSTAAMINCVTMAPNNVSTRADPSCSFVSPFSITEDCW